MGILLYTQTRVQPQGGGGGGLAFFVRNNIYSPIVPNVTHPNIEASGITIHGRGQDLDIFNVYIHPGACQNSIVLDDFSNLTNNCNYNTIIVGDFNSKNIIWGSPFTCKKGKIIEDFMDFKKLICLNKGSPPFFHDGSNTPILVGYFTGL